MVRLERIEQAIKNKEYCIIDNIKAKLGDVLDCQFTDSELQDILISLLRLEYLKSNEKLLSCLDSNDKYTLFSWLVDKLSDSFKEHINPQLIVCLDFKDPDVVGLMIYSMEFAFAMISGQTRATTTQKGFRERNRAVETIIVDTFIGLLGEVGLKKFLKREFKVDIELNRDISREIQEYESDIKNTKDNKKVSIKTTPNLKAVWAECPKGYDVGVFLKVSVPPYPLLMAFAHACGIQRLFDFSAKIGVKDVNVPTLTQYLEELKSNCGKLNTEIKCIVCGFMEIEKSSDVSKEDVKELPFLGKVREDRYFTRIDELKRTRNDWGNFIENYISKKLSQS